MNLVTNQSQLDQIPYNEQSVILVDKPLKWTSFDVVNKMRYALKHHYNIKKIKVGHAGTLDPLATGLLLICTGKATKQAETLQGMPKQYTGVIKLGATTISFDAEQPEENQKSVDHLTEKEVLEALNSFKGEIDQYPPHFSALKVDGQALYKWARKGVKKEIKSRKVNFYNIELIRLEFPFIYFCVDCSKGTYIRSFANDVGEKLNVGGYLHELRRTSIGDYKIEDAVSLEHWLDNFKKEEVE